MLRICLASIIVLFCSVTLMSCAKTVTLPADVRQQEGGLRKWLNSFVGKTDTEVAAILPNVARDTWDFQGVKQPKLECETSDGASLLLFLYDGKVVKVSMHIMSE
jgi:hypothetical protein